MARRKRGGVCFEYVREKELVQKEALSRIRRALLLNKVNFLAKLFGGQKGKKIIASLFRVGLLGDAADPWTKCA